MLKYGNKEFRNLQEQVMYLSQILEDGSITDGTNTVSIADLAALIEYAKDEGWIE
jgi:hypothetical protein